MVGAAAAAAAAAAYAPTSDCRHNSESSKLANDSICFVCIAFRYCFAWSAISFRSCVAVPLPPPMASALSANRVTAFDRCANSSTLIFTWYWRQVERQQWQRCERELCLIQAGMSCATEKPISHATQGRGRAGGTYTGTQVYKLGYMALQSRVYDGNDAAVHCSNLVDIQGCRVHAGRRLRVAAGGDATASSSSGSNNASTRA
jgi:hypothetical protein